jgi:hypothetical protein
MKDVPAIDPEIRGLLEEIVADPRSRMRLAPRRALREWFDTGETIRPREASVTKAERHLIEVHREALAELLREAAWIAYWKAPVFAHKPVASDGRLYDPADLEPRWRERARVYIKEPCLQDSLVSLLAECLEGLTPARAHSLAMTSLTLVGNDKTRFYLALSVPWDRPRAALSMLRRLSHHRLPRSFSEKVLSCIGARLCAIDALREARAEYSRVARGETDVVRRGNYWVPNKYLTFIFFGMFLEELRKLLAGDRFPCSSPNNTHHISTTAFV